jgi:hypothetical protein
MGAGVIEGKRILCEGDDIVGALNAIFDKQPTDPIFVAAKTAIPFFWQTIQTPNTSLLLGAYMAAGVRVTSWDHWRDYLDDLAAKDGDNIKTIAQARYDGLSGDKRMKTKKHPPMGGDHKVHRKDNGSIEIDSPFMPNSLCP